MIVAVAKILAVKAGTCIQTGPPALAACLPDPAHLVSPLALFVPNTGGLTC